MDQTENLLKMAGFNTAAALAWVSDGIPMPVQIALLDNNGRHHLFVIEEETARASALGEKKISELGQDKVGGVLIKDALISLADHKTDALLIDILFSACEKRQIRFIQPYRNAEHPQGFAVHPLRLASIQGFSAGTAHNGGSQGCCLSQWFIEGMKSHKEGAALLERHYLSSTGGGFFPSGDPPPHFSDIEFQRLLRSPLLVFSLVAAAHHDRLSEKELETLSHLLFDSGKYQNLLFSCVTTCLADRLPALVEERQQQMYGTLDELREIRRIIDQRTPPVQGKAFKQALLAFGRDVAVASAELFDFRPPPGRNGKAALAGIAQCLGVNTD